MSNRSNKRKRLGVSEALMRKCKVLVIEPNSANKWLSFASDEHYEIQADLFDEHMQMLAEKGVALDDDHSVEFTGFVLRERNIPVYKIALVFANDADQNLFNCISFGLAYEAGWQTALHEEQKHILIGHDDEIIVAKRNLINRQQLFRLRM